MDSSQLNAYVDVDRIGLAFVDQELADVFFGNSLISYKKQNSVSKSSTEAEYLSVSFAWSTAPLLFYMLIIKVLSDAR